MGVVSARSLAERAGRHDPVRTEIEEWDGDVYLVPLTGHLRAKLGYLAATEDGDRGAWLDLVPEIVRECVVDEDGGRIFATTRSVEPVLRDETLMAGAMKAVREVVNMSRLSKNGGPPAEEPGDRGN